MQVQPSLGESSFEARASPVPRALPPSLSRLRVVLPFVPLVHSDSSALSAVLPVAMDFFSDSRRHVNLAGGTAAASDSKQSRSALLEQARKERQARQQDKQREQAASKIQAFWRSRRAHTQAAAAQRALYDSELAAYSAATAAPAAAAGGSAAAAPSTAGNVSHLHQLVTRFFFFSLTAPRRVPQIPAHRRSAAQLRLYGEDEQRFRSLSKLLLVALRSPNKQQHFGSSILQSCSKSAGAATSTVATSTPIPAAAQRWAYSCRRIAHILLDRIANLSLGLDSVSSDVVLLWLLLDSNQWPWTKDPAIASVQDKMLVSRTQSVLVRSLVAPIGKAKLGVAPATSASSSSSAASSAASQLRPSRPVVDLFHSLRIRVLSLTFLASSGALAEGADKSKTSVAIMLATVLRAMTLCVPAQPQSGAVDGGADNPVLLSFVYNILSLPALPQRLRLLGLGALLGSFLTAGVWDRSMAALEHHLRPLNVRPVGLVSQTSLALQAADWKEKSHSWFDLTPLPVVAAGNDALASPTSTFSGEAPQYTYFSSAPSAPRSPPPISGLAWIFGNVLELVQGLDETKNPQSSKSFSAFLLAVDQLFQATPKKELPALGGGDGDGATLSASASAVQAGAASSNALLPPVLVKQFSLFGERSFLDRLCRRLMSDSASDPSSSSATSSTASGAVFDDVPIICTLIDSLLFRWSASSNAILNTLVFSSDIVRKLWRSIQQSGLLDRIDAVGKAATINVTPYPASSSSSAAAASSSSAVAAVAAPSAYTVEHIFADRYFNLLPLFATMYGHLLLILDDDEFFVKQQPFSLEQDVVPMVAMLKVLLHHLYWTNFSADGTPARLRERFSKLFVQLRDRQSRKPFMAPDRWLFTSPQIPVATIQTELQQDEELRLSLSAEAFASIPPSRAQALIHNIPFVLPFQDRVKLFYAHVQADKQRAEESGIQFMHGRGKHVRIRRKFVLEDSYAALSRISTADLKGRVQVEFIDEHGLPEAGLDGGGLFKEYLLLLLKTAFDPNYNLFRESPEHFLFPNPDALDQPEGADEVMQDEDQLPHAQQLLSYYFFLGQMISKAIYEGIQVEALFALFFLRACVGLNNYIDDLSGLDPVIYSSLMKLKAMDASKGEDVADLGLTFSVDRQVFGVTKSVDLIPNGANVPVTNDNKVRFIYLLADYYLSKQMSRQMQAFQQGMCSMVEASWLRMFAAEELRLLISGSQSVDLEDLQRYTSYHGGYSKDHELIRQFWQVVGEFDREEISSMLKFITSCSRAPLLGFRHMQPGFAIQRVEVDADEQVLPTAATCMNLLRLPRYKSRERLKQKLLYAFKSGAGFSLT